MASKYNDSDTSDDSDYNNNGDDDEIQIGICDDKEEIKNNIDFMINKIGGLPNYLPNKYFNLSKCSLCSNEMVLVAQLYCPLDNSYYHRVFYVMACINKSCWNKSQSWIVYRSQTIDNDYLEQQQELLHQQEQQSFKNDWILDESVNDNWNIDNDNNHDWNKDNSYLMDIQQQKPQEYQQQQFMNEYDEINNNLKLMNINKDNLNKLQFKSFYVNVVNNTKTLSSSLNNRIKRQIDEQDDDDDYIYDNNNKDTKFNIKNESYEKTIVKHGDKIFYKFRKKIDNCPQQIIRYVLNSNNAKPLFINKYTNDDDYNKMLNSNCIYCNSKLKYEFQLMPALVNYLKLINNNCDQSDNKQESNRLEFGVVIVYTCSNSCWNNENDLFKCEYAYVQSDPDQSLFSSF